MDAIAKYLSDMESDRGIIIVGLGKSDISSALIHGLAARGQTVLLVHEASPELLEHRLRTVMTAHPTLKESVLMVESKDMDALSAIDLTKLPPIELKSRPIPIAPLPEIEYAKPVEHQTPFQSLQQRHNKYRKRR